MSLLRLTCEIYISLVQCDLNLYITILHIANMCCLENRLGKVNSLIVSDCLRDLKFHHDPNFFTSLIELA